MAQNTVHLHAQHTRTYTHTVHAHTHTPYTYMHNVHVHTTFCTPNVHVHAQRSRTRNLLYTQPSLHATYMYTPTEHVDTQHTRTHNLTQPRDGCRSCDSHRGSDAPAALGAPRVATRQPRRSVLTLRRGRLLKSQAPDPPTPEPELSLAHLRRSLSSRGGARSFSLASLYTLLQLSQLLRNAEHLTRAIQFADLLRKRSRSDAPAVSLSAHHSPCYRNTCYAHAFTILNATYRIHATRKLP
jgi:hypothetical protein